MESSCRRAARIGVPALAFTDHLDLTGWVIGAQDLLQHLRPLVAGDGVLTPPPLEADDYLDSIARCRRLFPELRILSGVELGQPHLDEARARQVIDLDGLERVNGSLHTLATSDQPDALRSEPVTLYRLWPAATVVRRYLTELIRMVAADGTYAVVSHVDYAVRYWPTEREGPFDPRRFEDEFRQALRATAGTGRALELNIGGPLRPWIPQWWRQEGGRAVTIASDAHTAGDVGRNFYEAMMMAEHFGFRRGRRPEEFWTR
jgi:histidinol-phosphatase (PHP family)